MRDELLNNDLLDNGPFHHICKHAEVGIQCSQGALLANVFMVMATSVVLLLEDLAPGAFACQRHPEAAYLH